MPMPRLLVVDPARPEPSVIAEAAEVLRRGGLVAFPTETVYGLGAIGTDPRAVARIFDAKGRPAQSPLILHVSGAAEVEPLVKGPIHPRARALMTAFWPGPLTIVLPRSSRVPDVVTGGGDTVALRAPAHPVARALVAAAAAPIAAPSANRYQTISPTSAAHVVKSLGDAVELVLDGGSCDAGIESTVLDLAGDRPRVLRLGVTPVAELRAHLPDLEVRLGASDAAGEAHRSPGQAERHYAPRARVERLGNKSDLFSRAATLASERVGALLRGARAHETPASASIARVETLEDDPARYAHDLYAALHRLDDASVDVILVEDVPPGEAWAAVADRLERAAHRAENGAENAADSGAEKGAEKGGAA
jgi:L-threonylcarbamoyladenylate synthase